MVACLLRNLMAVVSAVVSGLVVSQSQMLSTLPEAIVAGFLPGSMGAVEKPERGGSTDC